MQPSTTTPSFSYSLLPFSTAPSITIPPSLLTLLCMPLSLTQNSTPTCGSPFSSQNLQCKALSLLFQTILLFSEPFERPFPTSEADESALPATTFFKSFTTIISSPLLAPLVQQTLKATVSTFNPQKQSYSNRAPSTPSVSAGSDMPPSLPSHQLHPAPHFSARHLKALFGLFISCCMTAQTKNWSSFVMMPVPPSRKPSPVSTPSPARRQPRPHFSSWPDSTLELAPS